MTVTTIAARSLAPAPARRRRYVRHVPDTLPECYYPGPILAVSLASLVPALPLTPVTDLLADLPPATYAATDLASGTSLAAAAPLLADVERLNHLLVTTRPESRRAPGLLPQLLSLEDQCGKVIPTRTHDQVTTIEAAVRAAAESGRGEGLLPTEVAELLDWQPTPAERLRAKVRNLIGNTAPLHQLVYRGHGARGRVQLQSKVLVEVLEARHQRLRREHAREREQEQTAS